VPEIDEIVHALSALRERRPLVHNITNYVAMNNTANALLALGASPAMVHAPEEVSDFVRISGALVINIGTLSASWVDAMSRAALTAREHAVPWVLDPVGVGATPFRSRVARALLAQRPTVLRGNASEILSLAFEGTTRSGGVDSLHQSKDATAAARSLARQFETVVVVSGEIDLITDGNELLEVANGHEIMTRVTGLGCTATAIVGAFLGAGVRPLVASAAAMLVLGLAGERAQRVSRGPGSLQVHLLDELASLDAEVIRAEGRLR
jgi:hydroxyethylthiazole kinase